MRQTSAPVLQRLQAHVFTQLVNRDVDVSLKLCTL